MKSLTHERPSGRLSKSRGLSASVSFLPLPLSSLFSRGNSLLLNPTETLATQARLLRKYVASLITNTENRFKASLPVLKAFTIFDVLVTPSARSPRFKEYADSDIKILTKPFFSKNEEEESDEADVNAEKLKAEWGSSRSILLSGKPTFQEKSRMGSLQLLSQPGVFTA